MRRIILEEDMNLIEEDINLVDEDNMNFVEQENMEENMNFVEVNYMEKDNIYLRRRI